MQEAFSFTKNEQSKVYRFLSQQRDVKLLEENQYAEVGVFPKNDCI